ncbi:SLBB domain-containing protein, partial [Micromonospora sp. NBS 11-29]|uniref:SLBB domain-containing protein n=1 Tax=Micromonospora sp. NBS 11-29 TaxID=1960879 RepID=UPI0020CF7313
MPDDEETTVRRRLARLFTPAGRTIAVPAPAGPAPDPVRPSTPAYPFLDPDLAGPRRGHPEPDVGPDPASMVGDADGHEEDAESGEPARGLAARLPGPGAFDPGRRGVRALAAVAALVVLVAAVWAWRSRPSAEPVRPAAPVTEASGGAASGGASAEVAAPAGAAAQVVVTVAGKVRRPGLVRLSAGARLADALEAAGGALPGVDVALLNPARKVTDGEL